MSENKTDYQIVQAQISDTKDLAKLASQTFIESHGHSASEKDIQFYVSTNLDKETLESQLSNSSNLFYLLYQNQELVGYSKITLNNPYKLFKESGHAKMERLYLLKKTLGSGLGKILFDFNIELAKSADQKTIWIYAWVENHRAISFYKKNGFKIIDLADFFISANHSNPNHIMQKHL